MDNYIDELALLKAFIDYDMLSYAEVQEKGIVPVLNKQDRRNLFKNSIEKFKRWELIETVDDSDPVTWKVNKDKALAEYNKLVKEIEQKQVIEKYSFQHLQEEVKLNSHNLKRIRLFRIFAATGFALAVFQFVTGLSLSGVFNYLKHIYHSLTGIGY